MLMLVADWFTIITMARGGWVLRLRAVLALVLVLILILTLGWFTVIRITVARRFFGLRVILVLMLILVLVLILILGWVTVVCIAIARSFFRLRPVLILILMLILVLFLLWLTVTCIAVTRDFFGLRPVLMLVLVLRRRTIICVTGWLRIAVLGVAPAESLRVLQACFNFLAYLIEESICLAQGLLGWLVDLPLYLAQLLILGLEHLLGLGQQLLHFPLRQLCSQVEGLIEMQL